MKHSGHSFFLFLILTFCGSTFSNGQPLDAASLSSVPRVADVGAARLPAAIAPVKAPFPMPAFAKPVFPKLTIRITDKGARAGAMATKAIQSAIDEVSKKKGGTVIVPAGTWRTGRISLKSNVNLHISEGAELRFSPEIEDYLPAVFTRNEGVELMSLGALIYANGQENIAVTGKGKLVGPPDGPVRQRYMNVNVIEKVVPADKPVSERVYEGKDGGFIFPPMFISPINCKKVYIEGITLHNTPFWNVVPVYCDNVIIRGITVQSVGIPRGDGIDIESSRNVLIEYCTLSSGDDCFTIKAGRGEDGIRVNKPTENVVIRHCLAREGHGGITCGSETAGMIRNVYVRDCVFDDTDTGLRFKTRRSRAGGGENIVYENIRMNLRGDAVKFDMLGSRQYVGELADRLPPRPVNDLTPAYRNITARNIVVDKARTFIDITGIPESPAANLLIENAIVNARTAFKASDAERVTVRGATLTVTDTLLRALDVRNVLFEKVEFNTPGKKLAIAVEGENSSNVRFVDCTPAKPEGLD
ncbi:glycoside hydrolase family 28 protein [Dyadobacter fermentans]|uniref:Glycoside hydrolase family 28 n=1 Tax=Dyadobacter fermentans (strain ATCC 700827 / DSM 18053 / CIP 107007 / KCTC 52180 / NS114) TaxID=471854 RepID=C6W0E0_DYAFD|nr:glycoside hydrolase family 28 protein [Dyadobacter fermentans]ACT91874.1 glycoside hydrolase family 28 [Dyadobacter fermentans DSM 18053]